jgi:D-alanine-D-alanine ligase
MRLPRVLILYNEPVLPPDHPDAESEHDILYTADVVSRSLMQAGFPVARLGVAPSPRALLDGLADHPAEVVFNLFEGTATDGDCEACVAATLEWLRIPFTGSPSQALCLARSKPLTKQLLRGAGLPTAEFLVVEGTDPCPRNTIGWPVIVKPGREDASIGIEQASVVTDQAALEARVEYVRARYGAPVLVERFIRGREFNVGLTELPDLRMLPVSEILFVEKSAGYWPIVSFDAKWRPGTRDFVATPPVNPAPMEPELAREVERLAKAAFRVVGCRDYARVDFRIDEEGRPYILEVNPNPCIAPAAGFAAGLDTAGITHPRFLAELVGAAAKRGVGNGEKAKTRRAVAGNRRGRRAIANSQFPNSDWKVRPARAADRPALRQVAASCEAYTADPYAGRIAELLAAPLRGQRRAGDHFTLVRRGRVGGWACLTEPRPGVFAVEALAVAAEDQGAGLGRQLLDALRQTALARGGRVLVAEVASHAAFASARQFLLREGFRLAGDVPDFYRPDQGRLTYVHYLDTPAATDEVPSNPSQQASDA